MQLLSEESFSVIEPLLTDDYKRIRSRLALILGQTDCEIFSSIDTLPNRAKWHTDAAAGVKPFADASAVEKEMIASFIEDAKAKFIPKVSGHVSGAENLFRVPDENCIYWYKDATGGVRVVLAQWGFRRSNNPGDVDVIEFLLAQPRPLSAVKVTLEAVYNYGAPITGKQFELSIFNNTSSFTTDSDGRYYIGDVKVGIPFEVTDPVTGANYKFAATSGQEIYQIVIDKKIDYIVKVVDKDSQPLSGYEFSINGSHVTTDAEGAVKAEDVLYNSGDTLRVSSPDGDDAEFALSPDAPNEFTYQVDPHRNDTPAPDPEPEPEPKPEPKPVRVRILDLDGSPLDGVEVFLDQPGGKTISAMSDADGVATFPRDTFVDKKKSKVRFVLTAEYQKARSERKKAEQDKNGK